MAQRRDDRDDTDLVLAARAGDGDAFGTLFDRWFDRVWDVAWHIVGDREVAAEVAQDVFLAAWQRLDDLRDPAAFGGWVLRTSRNRALNRSERERRSTPAGGTQDPVMATLPGDAPDPATAADDRGRHELVWAAAAALGERDASVLDLHLRHGLAPAEIAVALDVTPNHAHQLLFRLRERLGAAIRSWVLWRHGTPRCDGLRGALSAAGITGFGPEAVRTIGRHAGGCAACTADRDDVLAPDRLFAAVPIAAAPPLLKAKVAGALEAGGVPIAATHQTSPGGQPGRPGRPGRPRRGRAVAGIGAAVVVTIGLVVALAWRAGDGELRTPEATGDTGTTAAAAPETTTPATPTTSAPSTSVETATTTTGSPDDAGSEADPPGPPPTIATTTSTTTTTSPPSGPPTIDAFRVSPQPDACGPGTAGTAVVWQSSGGETHTLVAPDGAPTSVGPSGSQVFCPHQQGTWALLVEGPGGRDTAYLPAGPQRR